ncbi:MAG: TIGR02302 family protein [Pseudomonadota bacterium]
MSDLKHLPLAARVSLARAIDWTRSGMVAERALGSFWPLIAIVFAATGALFLGLHELLALEIVWGAAVFLVLGALWAGYRGAVTFRWPQRREAIARLDERLPGRPIQAVSDTQAIGAGDAASEALWTAHVTRMAQRVAETKATRPDLRLNDRDPYALRYVALLILVVGLMFGSILRVASVTEMTPGGGAQDLATGPVWEGWIEPPVHTGRPSLYLGDIDRERIAVPVGSRMTVRLYGEVGALTLTETVSGRTGDVPAASDLAQGFDVMQSGTVTIDGPGGRSWSITVLPDAPPVIAPEGEIERAAGGEMRQPYTARDDYGVVSGQAVIKLDMAALDRRFGLVLDPEPREDIVLDLPLPISGDRTQFTETLAENLSEHPWVGLPVTITLQATDAIGQVGMSAPIAAPLPGRRFFDPLANAIIEQRRDLLWNLENAKRATRLLRAVSHRPDDIFRDEGIYLRLRFLIRSIESDLETATLISPEARDAAAEALWEIALLIEEGDLSNALERLRRAQDRLSEAMRNGASDDEIAELMQELRDAMQDYMRQLAEQGQQNPQDQQQAQNQQGQQMTSNQLQDMMDRIQELMEQGRMAEAQALLDQLMEMMENAQVAQGQQGQQGQNPGQQAMEGLAETLRQQQGLSDETFGDLQDQFNPGQQQGQQGQQGQGQQPGGQQGQGQQPGGQQGQGQQPGGQPGQGNQQGQTQPGGQGQGQPTPGQPGSGPGGGQSLQESLADRQQQLRQELERQSQNMPGAGTPEGEAARDALDRAGRAMDGAEESLREEDFAGALDNQSEAMDALREGMQELAEQMAQQQGQQQGQQGTAQNGDQQGTRRDPLGREAGANGQLGTEDELLQGEDVYRRAREILEELRKKSGDQTRPTEELDYFKRLLDRF